MSTKNGVTDNEIKLTKPLTVPSGQVLHVLSLDIDKLTWGDLHNLEMEYAALFPGATPTNGIFLTDTKYQAMLVARINGLIYDNVSTLGARDAFTIQSRIGRFLGEPAVETPKDKPSILPVPSAEF